jgi:UDP-N-acetylmuramoylalanine--D-glutamate ligase
VIILYLAMDVPLRGRRVTVMGLGTHGGGVAAARYAARQGAHVTVTDLKSEAALEPVLAELEGVPLRACHLGGHRDQDFRDAEIVVANPAVPPRNLWLKRARRAGALITTEVALFVNVCPAPIIGVTGTMGKSTTAAMIASILAADGRETHLGGNIGGSLLDRLNDITGRGIVILELSSFQLQRIRRRTLGQQRRGWPDVAVVTSFAPHHLDWHGDCASYRTAKQRILKYQSADSLTVLNQRDPRLLKWRKLVRGRLPSPVSPELLPPLKVLGVHNRVNAALAAAAVAGLGCGRKSIESGLIDFSALPHRLQVVGSVEGRLFINDSKATTPAAACAALAARDRPVWLLAGGTDAGTDFDNLAACIARHARGACFFGSSARRLHAAVCLRAGIPLERVDTLRNAMLWCWSHASPGECILLSPACASHDQFADFAERGREFVRVAQAFGPLTGGSGTAASRNP